LKKIGLCLFLFLIACRPEKGALNFSDGTNSSSVIGPEVFMTPQLEAFQSSVYKITGNICVRCHGTIQKPFHGSPNLMIAYEAAKTRVNFSNPAGSTIVLKTIDGHCGIPEICKTDGSAMLAAVKTWALAEIVTPPPTTGGNVLMETASTRFRLSNRHFLASRLDQIFGPSQSVSLDALIRSQPIHFGGPCDKHNGDFVKDGNDEIMGECNERASSQAAMVPFPSSGRFALMTRSCDIASQSNTAVTYAVTRATGSNATTRAVTSADIDALHRLFYLKSPNAEVNAALLALAIAAQPSGYLESWRYVLFTLCSDPGWQIP
jgi:hypothetical protein